MIGLAVFLGNPGAEYAKNRHNAGRLLAERRAVSWQKKFRGLFAAVPAADAGKLCLLQPETFMNLSGDSVAACAAFYRIKPGEILVVHDELELALGQVALKFGGGLGGHNGLRSIKAVLSSADFWRLRIGIGRPSGRKEYQDVSDWVLSDFSRTEQPLFEAVLSRCDCVLEKIASGVDPETLLPEWQKITVNPGSQP